MVRRVKNFTISLLNLKSLNLSLDDRNSFFVVVAFAKTVVLSSFFCFPLLFSSFLTDCKCNGVLPMSSLNVSDCETEAAALRKQIHVFLKQTRQKTIAQRQQESLFLLSSTRDQHIRKLLRQNSPSYDAIVKLFQVSGEEELLEEECFRRYEAFIAMKASFFTSIKRELSNVIGVFHPSAAESKQTDSLKKVNGCYSAQGHIHDQKLQLLSSLFETATALHLLTTHNSLQNQYTVPLSFEENYDRELNKLDVSENVALQAISECQARLSEAAARARCVEAELVSLDAAREAGETEEVADRVGLDLQNDESAFNAAKDVLEALQSTTAGWLKKRKDTENAEIGLRDKLLEVTGHTAVCKQSTEALLSSCHEFLEAEAALKRECVGLASDLKTKNKQRLEQGQLLVQEEARYDALRSEFSQAENSDGAKTAEINRAELERQKKEVLIASAKQRLLTLEAEKSELKRQLDLTRSEKGSIAEEVSYLSSLAPEKANLEDLVKCLSRRQEHKQGLLVTQSYLDFIHRARASHRRN